MPATIDVSSPVSLITTPLRLFAHIRPAFRWQEQHDDALTEAALTNGAAGMPCASGDHVALGASPGTAGPGSGRLRAAQREQDAAQYLVVIGPLAPGMPVPPLNSREQRAELLP